MPGMPVWEWAPTTASSMRWEPNTETVRFGRGYEQRIEGPADTKAFNLTFERKYDVIWDMERFIQARRGVEAFEFQDPDTGEIRTVVADQGYTKSLRSALKHTLQVVFREVPTWP